MPSYSRFDVALVSGHNATAQDCEGKEYIDFTSGIGVNSLGYCDAKWAKAVADQAATLQHISNLYYNPVQTKLAETLCKLTGFSKVFLEILVRKQTSVRLRLPENMVLKCMGRSIMKLLLCKIRSMGAP